MKMLDLNIAGEFIVMASTLIHIKSRMLLPSEERREDTEEIEEDPRAELVKKLIAYKKFKEAGKYLEDMEQRRGEMFIRTRIEDDEIFDGHEEKEETFWEVNLFDLISAFSKVLKEIPEREIWEVARAEFTVEEKIEELISLLRIQPVIYFTSLFERVRNKLEIIVIFLALLELIRLKKVKVRQEDLFAEIQIIKIPSESQGIPSEHNSVGEHFPASDL
jgi:segregation and condensation protein A